MAAGEIGSDGTVTLPAQATVAGADGNVEKETITTIVNPGIPEGITNVSNPAAFEGGRARETDEDYRDRYYKSVDYAGGVNADAIRGEILQNVEGVYAVIVYENDTDEEDSDGLPAHSIEAVVYGGLDGDIAKQIFRRKAAGIQTHGGKSVSVLSDSGATYTIKFSRPTLVDVWVKITDLVTDEDKFPTNGKAPSSRQQSSTTSAATPTAAPQSARTSTTTGYRPSFTPFPASSTSNSKSAATAAPTTTTTLR